MSNTVFITGASRGIGRATALAFAAAGYRVGIGYLCSEDAALSLVKELADMGCMAQAVKGDVSSYADAQRMVQKIEQSLGAVEVLVNNAGIAHTALFTDTTEEERARIIGVNTQGAFNCTRAVLTDMISNKHGAIINVSSMWGVTGASMEVVYSASKAALIGFTKALAKELGPSNIRVNCVAPGVIDTDMNAGLFHNDRSSLALETPLMRIGTPEEVARVILFLAGEGAAFMTGQVIGVDGGFSI